MKAQFLQRKSIFSHTTSPNVIWATRFQITEPHQYHFIDSGSEEGRQRVTHKRSEVCFQELQASMETQTRAEQRDLSPCRSHIMFLCPYRFKHSLQKASLAHPGSLWEEYRDKSSQASETNTIWDWGACTQHQIIPTSCFQLQYIRSKGMDVCTWMLQRAISQKFKFYKTWNWET